MFPLKAQWVQDIEQLLIVFLSVIKNGTTQTQYTPYKNIKEGKLVVVQEKEKVSGHLSQEYKCVNAFTQIICKIFSTSSKFFNLIKSSLPDAFSVACQNLEVCHFGGLPCSTTLLNEQSVVLIFTYVNRLHSSENNTRLLCTCECNAEGMPSIC